MTEIELTDIEDGVFVFDKSGKLKFCSEYCETVLPGLAANLGENSRIEDVYAVIVNLGYVALTIDGEAGGADAGLMEFKSVPGEVDFKSDSGDALRWTSRNLGNAEIIATLSDNSRMAKRQLNEAQISKMFSISEMSGQIGHDLNNFLTIIQGNLELLETIDLEDEKFSRWVVAAITATERGSEMAKHLLYLGRRRPANRRDVEIAEVILEIVEKIQDQNSHKLQIEILIPSDLNTLRVDAGHLDIVLEQILLNAIEAVDSNGAISIAAENYVGTEIDQGEEEQPGVRITITDDGNGMPNSVKERAFEPYFTTKKDQKGAGLGLSIAFGFARQSDGTILLDSRPGQGTTAILEIPVGKQKIVLPETLDEMTLAELSGNERIMVVEDDSAVRAIAAEMLSFLGYEIVQATDAADALDQLNNGCVVDLVFSDVIMPGGLSGIQMARIIRDKYRRYKILLASGYVDSDKLGGIAEFTYLGKPYNQKELGQHIRKLLDQRN